MADNTHEWCADGATREIQSLPSSLFPWWMEKLRKDEIIRIRSLSQMPPEASAEQKILEPQGIGSLIVLPLMIRQGLAGFIGFDDVGLTSDWTDEDVDLLRIISEIIGNALEREQADASLYRKNLELQKRRFVSSLMR